MRAFIRDGRRDGGAAQGAAPRRSRRDTAATLTDDHGGGRRARHGARSRRSTAITIAGKTGTAAKIVNGHYSKSDYNASFVGFLPSRNPAFTILVVIDSPHAQGYYGGAVAAPIFKRIAEATLRHLGIAPTLNRAAARARGAPRRAAAGHRSP